MRINRCGSQNEASDQRKRVRLVEPPAGEGGPNGRRGAPAALPTLHFLFLNAGSGTSVLERVMKSETVGVKGG